MNVSRVPEVIVRDIQAVTSGGIFGLHRINAVEYAWRAYNDKRPVDAAADDAADATAASDAYRATVGFGNGDIDLCSGSSMSPSVNIIDRYTPPRGSELIHSSGKIVRPEQKSVTLFRDIIRLFAPNPTEVVVDICAGTMSTVIAALPEGRPVYACALFKDCFEVGQRRVYNFQYRSAAAGLMPGLSPEDVTRVQRFIPAHSAAQDTLTHDLKTYTVHSPPPE
jgi:hypothetical protein